jgi:predicted O-methyltransferase YrrM
MTIGGTAAYRARLDLPVRVRAAVELAVGSGFDYSCLPEQGELLRLLAVGVGAGRIGETGTGSGVGLAWLATGAHPDGSLVSIERDGDRAARAAAVFADDPRVRVRTGDFAELRADGPFDLLVLDGGGAGKGADPPIAPEDWLRPGGLVVIDDLAPLREWPPMFEGRSDTARLYWLEHPRLRATQLNVTPTAAAIVATFLG